MSQENVEAGDRLVELWNRGDMEGLRECYHPDVVMHHPPGWPEPGPSVGREAVLAQLGRLRENVETDELARRVLADPDDWVVSEYHWSAVGRESGLPMDLAGAQAARYSDGRIIEVRFFGTREKALEAVGLRE